MEDDVEARRTPARRTIVFGCLGCLGAVILVIGVASVLDLDAIQEVLEVSSALRDEFGIDTEVSTVKDFGSGLTSLEIDVRSPDFQGEDPGSKAREIALFAAKILSSPERFAQVEVHFVKRIGGMIRFEAGKEYRFPMSELLPPEPVGSDD